MNGMLKDLPRALVTGFVEVLMYFPVLYIPMVYFLPDSLLVRIWPLFVVLGYAIGFAGSKLLRLNTYVKAFLWAVFVAVGISYVLFGRDIALLIAIPSLFVTCFRGIRMEHIGFSYMYSGQYFLIGLAIYGISSLVLGFIDSFEPYIIVMTIAGAGALILTLFIVNRNYVEQQTLPGSERPVVERRVLRQNKGMIVILLLLIGIIVLLPQLQRWIAYLGRSIASWLGSLLKTSSGNPEAPEPEAIEVGEMPFPDETSEPAVWAIILEKLAFYMVYIGAAVLILFLLYGFVKKMPSLYKKISAWMNRLMSRHTIDEAVLGYEDEEIEIEHEKAAGRLRRLLTNARKNGFRQPTSEPEDNAAKIRWLYRRILTRKIREGYKWKASRTPRETKRDMMLWKETDESISDELLQLYEQARYGHLPIRDEEWSDKLNELKRK